MQHFGSSLAELRKARKLSQAEMAAQAGVSQATVSRLEASEKHPTDVRLLAKLAKALETPLSELLPAGSDLPFRYGEQFYAFCPNPFCSLNRTGIDKEGVPFVSWTSTTSYPSNEFDEVNYCATCGTELVKDCPSCKRRFDQQRTNYCVTCGERVSDHPTEEEWARIRANTPKRNATEEPTAAEEDIPF
jgi:DNA-binding XRE family transcriptional regulator